MFDFLHFNETKLLHLLCAFLLLIGGYWVASWVSGRAAKVIEKILSKHEAAIFQRLIFYGALLLFLIAALQELGFKLGVLLGAAGVFTIGIGFAAQTSVANLISGLFLWFEHPFKIGDTVIVKGFTGVVESIDLLSTRLRTVDNTLVRIPNENIMQVEIVNLSYFSKRRVDLILGVASDVDFETLKTVLLNVARNNAFSVSDPEPKVIISDFGASTLNIKFSVWGTTIHYSDLKNTLQEEIKVAFKKANIDMPFPQMTIHSAKEEKLDTASNSA